MSQSLLFSPGIPMTLKLMRRSDSPKGKVHLLGRRAMARGEWIDGSRYRVMDRVNFRLMWLAGSGSLIYPVRFSACGTKYAEADAQLLEALPSKLTCVRCRRLLPDVVDDITSRSAALVEIDRREDYSVIDAATADKWRAWIEGRVV